MNYTTLEKIRRVIFGHAVADAVGVPAEFRPRYTLDDNPITDMTGYGTYNLPAGCWSDDTTMNLAALDSLTKGSVDYDEIMENFAKWVTHGEYTPEGKLFDIGVTCSDAIARFQNGTPAPECGASDPYSNGNGSLMRILPFVLYAKYRPYDGDSIALYHDASALTHGHMRSKIACGIYGILMEALLDDPRLEVIPKALEKAHEIYPNEPELSYYSRIFEKDFANTPREEIQSSGYVVASMEAALWCVLTTQSYRECVLKAVNLGNDTDTVAAIAGGIAGLIYGFGNPNGIPDDWMKTLRRADYIEEMCSRACQNWEQK